MNKQQIGRLGEEIAQKYLENKGFLVVLKNFRVRGGEIDLICQKAGKIHFIEVKTRTNQSFGFAEESINYFKRQRLKTAILEYLSRQKKRCLWQADAVVIELDLQLKKAGARYYQAIEL